MRGWAGAWRGGTSLVCVRHLVTMNCSTTAMITEVAGVLHQRHATRLQGYVRRAFSAVNRPKTAGTSPVNDRRFDLEGKQFGLSTNDYCSLYCICSTVANVQEQILIVKDLVKAS